MTQILSIPTVSVSYAGNGQSIRANELGMRPMQERVFERRCEQYLLIKSPPASGKSRALMFVALDKLHNQGIKQAIIVVLEKTIGRKFSDLSNNRVALRNMGKRRIFSSDCMPCVLIACGHWKSTILFSRHSIITGC